MTARTAIGPHLNAIAESAAKICDASDAGLWLRDGAELVIHAHHGSNAIDFARISIGRDWVTGRAFVDRKPVLVRDLMAEADEFPAGHAMATRMGHRAILAVPLLNGGEAIGAIAIRRLNVKPFTRKQIAILECFANQAAMAIENARLFEEVQTRNRELSEALDQQTATADVLKAISTSTFDLGAVLQKLVDSAARLCSANYAGIMLRQGDRLICNTLFGASEEDLAELSSQTWPIDLSTVSGRVMLSRRVEQIPDVHNDPDHGTEHLPWMSATHGMMGVPLRREGKVEGVFFLGRSEFGAFPDRLTQLIQTFADQAVIAIENARLFEQVQSRNRELAEALEQQTATAEVLKAISRSVFDLRSVLDRLVESAAKLAGTGRAVICLRDGEVLRPVASFGASKSLNSVDLPMAIDRGSLSGRVVLSGEAQMITDVLADAEYVYGPVKSSHEIRSMLAVPLVRQGRIEGTFIIERPEPGPFSARDRDLLQTFADQAMIAIENSRLFEQVQARNRELAEALRQQTATADVLKAISRSTFDLQTVLNTLVESAARLCEADHAWLFQRDGEEYRWRASFGFSREQHDEVNAVLKPLRLLPGRGSVTQRAALEGKVAHIVDVLADPDYERRDAQAAGCYRTALGVPLLREGSPIGVMVLTRSLVRAFTSQQIELITTFADQAVIAIENARLFEEVQARTRELSESLEYQTATSEVLNVISRSPTELQPVLDVILETSARLCEADFAWLWRRDGEVFRSAAGFGFSGDRQERVRQVLEQHPVVPGRGSITGRAVLEGRAVHVADVMNVMDDPEYNWHEVQKIAQYRTCLSVPLLRENTPIGVVALTRSEVRPFSPRQIELITTFADQAVIAVENARLFEEVQARNRELRVALDQQTATSELLKVVGRSTIDIQPVFDAMAESAARLCEAERAVVFRFNGELLSAAAWHNPSPELIEFIQAHPLRLGRHSAAARAGLERRTIHIHDIQTDTDYSWVAREIDPIGSVLAVPMLRGEELLGVTVIYRLEVRPFSPSHIALMATFADQAVIAIENARLFEEVQARTRELTESLEFQTATSDVLGVISRSPTEAQPVFDAIVSTARTLCHSERATVWRLDQDSFRPVAFSGMEAARVEQILERRLPVGRGSVIGRAAEEGRAVQVLEPGADPTLGPEQHAIAQSGNVKTILVVPLIRNGKPIGGITVSRTVVSPFTERQTALLETFADQAVIAIENARLFEEVQARTAELARSVGELEALGEVSQAVNSTLDLQKVLETIVAKAVQLSGTAAGAIYVYSKSTDRFRLKATYGMSPELIAAVAAQSIGLSDPGLGEAARNRAPVQYPDLAESATHAIQRIVLEAGFRSTLVVPLLRPRKVVGALVVRRRTTGLFPDATVKLMETFAAQSVLAIQNARLFSEIEEKSRELELASRHKSQFLANMSHELRTPLNSVLGFTEMLVDGLYGDLPDKAKATLGRVQANGKHLLGLINDVLDLSKIEAGQLTLAIEDYSMGQIVRSIAATTEPLAKAKGLRLTAILADGLPFGRGDERRIAQVLLNLVGNAVKFTDRGSIEIEAVALEGNFRVSVRDTGPGIAPEHQARIFEEFQQVDESNTRTKGGTGLGLAISKRIVEMHGGSIELDSTTGVGSTFRIVLPVRAVESERAA